LSSEEELYQQRIGRIAEIEALGFKAYGHRFDFTHTIQQILAEYSDKTAEQLEPHVPVRVAGRILTVRRMGKAGSTFARTVSARTISLCTSTWIWATSSVWTAISSAPEPAS
jgi:lysyl-tRNA synthetase class 2